MNRFFSIFRCVGALALASMFTFTLPGCEIVGNAGDGDGEFACLFDADLDGFGSWTGVFNDGFVDLEQEYEIARGQGLDAPTDNDSCVDYASDGARLRWLPTSPLDFDDSDPCSRPGWNDWGHLVELDVCSDSGSNSGDDDDSNDGNSNSGDDDDSNDGNSGSNPSNTDVECGDIDSIEMEFGDAVDSTFYCRNYWQGGVLVNVRSDTGHWAAQNGYGEDERCHAYWDSINFDLDQDDVDDLDIDLIAAEHEYREDAVQATEDADRQIDGACNLWVR